MAKHWNTCWICGTGWSSTVPSNDCGKNDQQHRDARNPPPKPEKK